MLRSIIILEFKHFYTIRTNLIVLILILVLLQFKIAVNNKTVFRHTTVHRCTLWETLQKCTQAQLAIKISTLQLPLLK